jgi:hypothetical protein
MMLYMEKELNKERLDTRMAKMEQLRKTMHKGHVFLTKHGGDDYTLALREGVAVSKKRLTDLTLYFEEQRATLGKREDSETSSDVSGTAPSEALQKKYCESGCWADDCVALNVKITEFRADFPKEEACLYEDSEYLKIFIDKMVYLRCGTACGAVARVRIVYRGVQCSQGGMSGQATYYWRHTFSVWGDKIEECW